jgi:hypothetical protein
MADKRARNVRRIRELMAYSGSQYGDSDGDKDVNSPIGEALLATSEAGSFGSADSKQARLQRE